MDFQSKFTTNVNKAVQEWWKNLTKEELIAYIQTQPQITADYLRTMLANEGICIQFGASFNCNEQNLEASM